MIDEKFLVELQNATSDCKKDIIKTTLKKLSTRNARRNYLKQLGIKFDEKRKLFSGGADNDLELKSLLCPITRMIFIEPVVAENGVTYEKSALISELRTSTNNLSFTKNKVMLYKVFKLKSEMGHNRKIQTFFRRHWNNRLAKKIGLGTYSTLSGWSSGTVGELYGIASRNDQIKNRIDTMLRSRTGKTKTLNNMKNLAKMVLYLLLFFMLFREGYAWHYWNVQEPRARERIMGTLNPQQLLRLQLNNARGNPEELLRIRKKYAFERARGRERGQLLQQLDKTITQIARRDQFEEGLMSTEPPLEPWGDDGWLSYALSHRCDRFEGVCVEDDGTIKDDGGEKSYVNAYDILFPKLRPFA